VIGRVLDSLESIHRLWDFKIYKKPNKRREEGKKEGRKEGNE
jgi:hypothetical protein